MATLICNPTGDIVQLPPGFNSSELEPKECLIVVDDVKIVVQALSGLPLVVEGLVTNNSSQVNNVFVDAVNGSDGLDGLTPATALKTIGAVVSKFPTFVTGDGRISVNLADDGAMTRLTRKKLFQMLS